MEWVVSHIPSPVLDWIIMHGSSRFRIETVWAMEGWLGKLSWAIWTTIWRFSKKQHSLFSRSWTQKVNLMSIFFYFTYPNLCMYVFIYFFIELSGIQDLSPIVFVCIICLFLLQFLSVVQIGRIWTQSHSSESET